MTAPQPRPASLGRSNVEQTEALAVLGFGVLLDPEACRLVLRLVDGGLERLAGSNGMRPVLPPGFAAVLSALRGCAAQHTADGPSLTAVVAATSSESGSRAGTQGKWPHSGLHGHLRVGSREAAERWQVTGRHVRNLAAAGRLPAALDGKRHWTLPREFVDEHRTVESATTAHRMSSIETEDRKCA